MDRGTIAKNWKVTSEGSTAPIENGSTRQLQWLLHIEVSWWMGICSHMKSSDAECRERSQVLAQCLYNTMQCLYNVMQWLHRGQDLAQYCDSKGARHGRTCGACGAWIKESQRVSFELCVEEEESLCGGGRISQRGWSIIADATPLHTMGCLTPKDLENRYCEIWFIWCMLQCQ